MPTWNDPSPLANPLTSRSAAMRSFGSSRVRMRSDPSRLTVPNQDIPYNGSPEWNELHRRSDLTVPNQDIPYGDRLGGSGSGFLPGRSDLFRLPDGTVLDFRRHVVVKTPSGRDSGYWGDPSRTITMDGSGVVPQTYGVSRDISMEELVNNVDRYKGTALPDGELLEPLDPKSAAYWLKAEEEAEKLMSSMTDEQKAAIAAFEAHFPKSRLIEESKKQR